MLEKGRWDQMTDQQKADIAAVLERRRNEKISCAAPSRTQVIEIGVLK
ncbi:hypothetical protein ACU4GI_40050 [Cupriavidus basilensis]